MSMHLEWDRLNDCVDGRLSAADEADVREHLAECRDCRSAVDALRALGAGTRALPPAIEPPPGLWQDVAATIAAGGARTGKPLSSRPPDSPPVVPVRPGPSRRWLAAAAVVLMALSSGITALVLRRDGVAPVPVVATGTPAVLTPVAAGGTAPVVPASFAATEAAYLDSLAELHAAFVAQRHALAPTTIAVVERSLLTIDAAIAEARAALVADPANQALAELLSTSYRQKVELLRRAAESSET